MRDVNTPIPVVFAGTPDFSALCLQALIDSPLVDVVAVYSQPDRPKGRGKKLQPSPVKILAQEHQIPLYQPLNFKDPADQASLKDLKPALMVVVAYGLLLPQAVLDIPTLGCINVHASLLPRWRGAAPIERAIEAGDDCTGVTIMQMEAGLDTGPMLLKTSLKISPEDSGDSLREKLASQGSEALLASINSIIKKSTAPEVQDDSLATYAKKLQKDEAPINWNEPADIIARRIQAFSSSNVCWCSLPTEEKERLKVWQCALEADLSLTGAPGEILQASKNGITVACGRGAISLKELQLPGKRAMSAADMLNSRQSLFAPQTVLQ